MDIKFLEDCLLVENILVIGDFHLGYEEQVIEKGILPRVQLKEILEKLEKVFKELEGRRIKKIILLGDLKHRFKGILDSEWRDVLKLLDYLIKKCDEVVLIKGNHDNILNPIIRKRGIKLKDYYKLKIDEVDVCFLHGNKMFNECLNSKILIMGHLHPAIVISDSYKQEKFKCFLKGKWNNKTVYVLPSFSEMSQGYDLRKLSFDKGKKSFIIIENKNLLKFNVIVYNNEERKIHDFGMLKKLIDSCLK